MMKRKLPVIAIMALFVIGAGIFYSISVSDAKVDQSGVVIKTGSPEETVKTYYELISKDRYEPAAALQTKQSQKTNKAKDLKAQYKQVRLTTARLAKVFDAVSEKDIAVVGDIRLVKFPGNNYDSAIVSVTVLTNRVDKNKWEIVNSLEEVGKENFLTLLEMLIKLDKQMKDANIKADGFTDVQTGMIAQQLKGISKFHKEQLDEYKSYLKGN
ncbi:MAG: hypothetical protein ACOY4Q_06705 [Bacillota bacterium]